MNLESSGGKVYVKLSARFGLLTKLFYIQQYFEVSPKGLKDGVVRQARWLVRHRLCGVS